MKISRNVFGAVAVILVFVSSAGTLHAGTLPFGVFGFQLDISANVKDSLLPSGAIVGQNSLPISDAVQGDSAKLLYLSPIGVNGSGRSTNISGAFSSSLAAADGNGGVGVSQLIFGSPDGAGGQDVVRQLLAQSLWTQTFSYTGTFPVDLSLHLHIPELQVGLVGVAPQRTGISATELAEAVAQLDTVITHPDGTISHGGSFEFGLKAHEIQLVSGTNFLNFGALDIIGSTGGTSVNTLHFNGDDFEPTWTFDPFSRNINLGTLRTGDILSYVYTLTAEGTTHGFEHGYDAFLGDPFGVDGIGDNLTVTVSATGVPEPNSATLLLMGLTGVLVRQWSARK
jgi:hypothetical protein